MLGTLGYMSPEQAEGEPLDHRTDLWSLGVVLYEMLAGRRPFPGATPSAVAEAILSGDPAPVSKLRPEIPAGLDRILTTALGKTPAARYQSAQAFERDLLGLGLALDLPAGFTPSGGLLPIEAPPTAPPARRRWALAAALIVAAGAMAVAVWALAGAPVHLGGALSLTLVASRPLSAVVLQWTLWLALMTVVMRWLGRTRERQTDAGAGTLAHPRSTLIIGLVCTGFFLACAVGSVLPAGPRRPAFIPYFFLGFAALGVPMILDWRNARHTLVPGGLRYRSMLGARRRPAMERSAEALVLAVVQVVSARPGRRQAVRSRR